MNETPSAEERIHDLVMHFVQRIFDETGIRINDLRVNWIDVSSIEGAAQKVASINLETAAIAGHKQGRDE